MTEEQGCWGP